MAFAGLGAVLAAAVVLGAFEGTLGRNLQAIAAMAALLPYALAVRRGASPRDLRFVLVAAMALRLGALALPPRLSDDVYRYCWDGRVAHAGINPYRFPPLAPELARLRDGGWPLINHPELRTIYPPAAQAIFWTATIIGSSPGALQAAAGAAELAALFMLARLARRGALSGRMLLAYAWCPLVLFEAWGNAHVDAAVGTLLLAAALASRRPGVAGLAWAGAVLVKLMPLALAPLIARRAGVRGMGLAAGLIVAAFAPFALAGTDPLASARLYARTWEGNGFAYPPLQRALAAVGADEIAKKMWTPVKNVLGTPPWSERVYFWLYPEMMARAALAGLALTGIVWLALRGRGGNAGPGDLACGYGIVLLALPVLHPWYFLGLLPLAAAAGAWPWILAACLAGLSYFTPALAVITGSAAAEWLVRLAQFGPLFFAFARFRAVGRHA